MASGLQPVRRNAGFGFTVVLGAGTGGLQLLSAGAVAQEAFQLPHDGVRLPAEGVVVRQQGPGAVGQAFVHSAGGHLVEDEQAAVVLAPFLRFQGLPQQCAGHFTDQRLAEHGEGRAVGGGALFPAFGKLGDCLLGVAGHRRGQLLARHAVGGVGGFAFLEPGHSHG